MALDNLIKFKKTIAALAFAAALVPSVAFADGQPSYMEAPADASTPAFSWTGFYAGLNAGGGFSSSGTSRYNAFGTNGVIHGVKGGGVVGGVQLGYNYQLSPMFVIGVEDDFSVTNISKNYGSSSRAASLPWLGGARARAGVTFMDDRLLAYGTAGLAFGKVNNTGIELRDTSFENMRLGWTAGAGLEWAVMPQVSIKGEYLYTDLDKTFKDDGVTGPGAKFQEIRAGVNYHFNLF